MRQQTKSDMTTPEASSEIAAEPISLVGIFARFLRRAPVFGVVAALVFAVAVVLTLLAKPSYTATASVVIKHENSNPLLSQLMAGADRPLDPASVDTEVGVFHSRPLAARVVETLHLQQDPEFNPSLAKPKQSLLQKLSGKTPSLVPVSADQQTNNTISTLLSKMKARRSGLTYQIDVAFTSRNGPKAALIANTIVDEYLRNDVESKNGVLRGTSEFVDNRLKSLGDEVKDNDAALQQYKVAHNLVIAQGATIAEQQLSALNIQIASARAELAEKQARLSAARQQISKGGGGGDVGAALGSPVIQRLREQRAELLRQQADFSERYGPLHPNLTQVNRQIAENENQIQEEIGRIVSNLEAEVSIAQGRLRSLSSSQGATEGSLGANTQAGVGLNELQRKAEASRTIYEAFLNKSKESTAQQGFQEAGAKIVSRAEAPPYPTSPNRPFNLAVGLIVAMGCGLAAILIAENLDTSLLTSKEVESRLQMPCIGEIPLLTKTGNIDKMDYPLRKPFSAFAEAFRSLRTSLNASRTDRQVKVVTFASALPGEGKTLTTLVFGRVAAQAGLKTLIIDGDLRRRQLTQSFNRPVKLGMVEVLEGTASLNDALLRDDPSGASLLLLSEREAPVVDLVGGDPLRNLLQLVRERFDIIVIDTAPVLAVAETRIIAAESDATIFLTRWAKTSRGDSEAALDLVIEGGAFVAGVCLTQVDMAKQTLFGFGDKAYNFDKYRTYYVG